MQRVFRVGRTALATGVLALLLSVLSTVWAGPASAHAFLTGSNPADGAVLTSAPSVLRLDFSESVTSAATRIDISDSRGRHFAPTSLRVVGGGDTEAPSHLVADLPVLPRSAYRIAWRTLSSDDLHTTSGTLVFGIEAAVEATPFSEPAPHAEEAVLRWALFLSLAVALGAQLMLRLLRRADGHAPVLTLAEQCGRIGYLGSVAGLLTTGVLLGDQVMGSGAPVDQLLGGAYGVRWALRAGGFVLLAVAARRTGAGRRLRTVLVTTGAGAVCVASALLGHAAGSGVTRVAADASHLAATATWSGSLIVAALVLLPRSWSGDPARAHTRSVLRGFRLPAAACVGITLVTGVYLTSGVVGSVDALLLTDYGRILLVKIGVVVVVGALGLVNTRRLHAEPGRRPPARTVLAEAAAGVVVLALAALLTSGQPALEPRFVATASAPVVPVLDSVVADLQESLSLRPNVPGRTIASVGVFDTRRPAPAPITRVLVSVAGADGELGAPVVATRFADGQWSVPSSVTSPGAVHIRVTVERAGLADARHDYAWVVGGTVAASRAATVSAAPIGDTLRAVAAVLAIVGLLVWSVVIIRPGSSRRRRAGNAVTTGDADEDTRPLVGVG